MQKTMKHLIEILIVSILLFMLAFFVGCKDEAEAKEDVWLIIDSNDPKEPNEPNCINIDWEPDYPVDLRLHGKSADYVEFKLGGDHEIVCDSTRDKWLRVLYESMSGKEPNNVVTLRFETPPEPNEPDKPIPSLLKCFERLLEQVDTLIILIGDCQNRIEKLESHPILNIPVTENPEDISLSHNPLTKGTKIYFKEDE